MIQFLVLFFLWATVVTGTTTTTTTAIDVIEAGCPNYPDSPIMNDEFRTFMLNLVNSYRSKIAKGIYPTSDGKVFPAGKNINKLKWDCRVEEAGRIASETCKLAYHSDLEYFGWGQVYFYNHSALESPKRAMEMLTWNWFRQSFGELVISDDGETYLKNSGMAFMNDKHESFGCWYGSKNCNSAFSFNDPNATITAICGWTPNIARKCNYNPDGRCNHLYALGSPCTVDADCTNPNGFTKCDVTLGLCTDEATPNPTTTPSTTPSVNPCSPGWFYYAPTNGCYRFVNGTANRSQAQAEQWCVNQGKKGHLVSIHSEAEDAFVRSLIPVNGDNILIGYNNFTWTDGTPVNWSRWENAVPENSCAAYRTPNYFWKTVPCNGPVKQFICKRNP